MYKPLLLLGGRHNRGYQTVHCDSFSYLVVHPFMEVVSHGVYRGWNSVAKFYNYIWSANCWSLGQRQIWVLEFSRVDVCSTIVF